jgi:hypothetical protein
MATVSLAPVCGCASPKENPFRSSVREQCRGAGTAPISIEQARATFQLGETLFVRNVDEANGG